MQVALLLQVTPISRIETDNYFNLEILMKAFRRSLALSMFLWIQLTPLAAQEPEERLWRDTGETRHGTIAVQRGPSSTLR